MQVGTPREVYNYPSSKEVMDFLGKANFLDGRLESANSTGKSIRLSDSWRVNAADNFAGTTEEMTIAFRPHEVELFDAARAGLPRAIVKRVIYTGASEEILLEHAQHKFYAHRICENGTPTLKSGEVVGFAIPDAALKVFPKS